MHAPAPNCMRRELHRHSHAAPQTMLQRGARCAAACSAPAWHAVGRSGQLRCRHWLPGSAHSGSNSLQRPTQSQAWLHGGGSIAKQGTRAQLTSRLEPGQGIRCTGCPSLVWQLETRSEQQQQPAGGLQPDLKKVCRQAAATQAGKLLDPNPTPHRERVRGDASAGDHHRGCHKTSQLQRSTQQGAQRQLPAAAGHHQQQQHDSAPAHSQPGCAGGGTTATANTGPVGR